MLPLLGHPRSLPSLTLARVACPHKVSFAELAWRASQPPRHALLLGYVKATWDAKNDRVGDLSTVFNPQAKGAPLYWHPKDFLLVMSITGSNWSNSTGTLTVVR